jgi:hypothetical protein
MDKQLYGSEEKHHEVVDFGPISGAAGVYRLPGLPGDEQE